MDRAVDRASERRGSCRCALPLEGLDVIARLKPGHVVSVLDISASGTRLETGHRVLPGQCVEVYLTINGRRASLRGVAVRVEVARLQASRVWYTVAVAFDQRLTIPAGAGRCGHDVPAREARTAVDGGQRSD